MLLRPERGVARDILEPYLIPDAYSARTSAEDWPITDNAGERKVSGASCHP